MKINNEFYNNNIEKAQRLENLKKIIDNEKLFYFKKIITIAGTNGKGSTANYLSNMLDSVGLFTSPHILKINERIKINNKDIKDEDFERIYKKNEEIFLVYKLNFFDVVLIIALIYFKENNLQYIILECGIGGLYDSTNLLENDISIITNIGFDHQDILGNTLRSISFQKSGIIKGNSICFTGTTKGLKILKEEANKKKSILKIIKPTKHNVVNSTITIGEYVVPTQVSYQGKNAKLAITVAEYLKIPRTRIQQGLDNFYWPCRFEKIKSDPDIYLDGAHNIHAIKILIKELPKIDNPVLLLGFINTKDYKKMILELKKNKIEYYLTVFENEKAVKKEQLIKHGTYVQYAQFLKENKRNLVITGSFYFLSEIKRDFS